MLDRSKEDLINELISLRRENQALKARVKEYQYIKEKLNESNEKLRSSEERFRLVLANSSMVVFNQDQELRYTWMENPAPGFSVEEVLGKTDKEVFPDDYLQLTEIKSWVLKTGICFRDEVRVEIMGEEIYFDLSVHPVFAAIGTVVGITCVSTDITMHKHMEKALRYSEECFSKAFMVSPIPMSISRQEDGVYLDVNDSYLQAAGYSREELIGRSSLELSMWGDKAGRAEILGRLRRGEKVRDVEVKYCNKKGKGMVLVSLEPIIIKDTKCILSMLTDITERRQMEKDMARLDRLSHVGEMAASIGHEIRNPMTAVRGFIQLLSEQENYLNDRIYLDLMIEELDRANDIISEYLGMARDKIVDLQPHYLDQVIEAIYPMLNADANYKGMQIELDLGKPPMPLIDVKEIRQLIFNMARNGFEAMAPYGTLTIGTTTGEGEIVMYIKDQGQGLPDELLDKLGTPFVTTKENGTGLGLAVCYSIAARHKARIDYETGSGGTTFYVRFPLPVL